MDRLTERNLVGKRELTRGLVNLPEGGARQVSRRGRGDIPFRKVQQEGFGGWALLSVRGVGQVCPTYFGS